VTEMIVHRRALLIAAAALSLAGAAAAAPQIGAPAPDFQAMDAEGHPRALKDFAGKVVVLEWISSDCPYTAKHYNSGTMQSLQKAARKQGVVWLTLSSAAPGRADYFTPQTALAWRRKVRSAATAILLDGDGKIGRAYGAKVTPHMFVVDAAGRLVYMGGIDDRPYADPASLKGARPYVALALADLKAGRAVATPVTAPYGCSIRYGAVGGG
jgi:peroxiredoxin